MGKKVLVVDDNQLMRKLVECFLNKHGWRVELCEGPFGVINKAKDYRPDIILMDLKMPGLGGDKLASMLKKTSNTADIKIISFSSEDEELQRRMVEQGLIDGYFVKGHSFIGLCEEIGRVIGAA